VRGLELADGTGSSAGGGAVHRHVPRRHAVPRRGAHDRRADRRSSAQRLAAQLREASLPMARLKTGTPPRLDGRTIDWARLEEQPSDSDRGPCRR
jgi:tRNA uridine 5-carboxymethylaminomethyl modification enzyme